MSEVEFSTQDEDFVWLQRRHHVSVFEALVELEGNQLPDVSLLTITLDLSAALVAACVSPKNPDLIVVHESSASTSVDVEICNALPHTLFSIETLTGC